MMDPFPQSAATNLLDAIQQYADRPRKGLRDRHLSMHLRQLEDEAIEILREGVAQARNPVFLYSAGKDSTTMLHLARKAFYPGPLPFQLLHIATLWDFRDLLAYRDMMTAALQLDLVVHVNASGVRDGVNPISSSSAHHAQIMSTEGLKQALDKYQFDVAFGGARRDEEKSRAKERIFSFRTAHHAWEPRNQRPELWNLYNARTRQGEFIRVFPLSNWTEHDVWSYLLAEEVPIVPLYFSDTRPVVYRDGTIIMRDDDRLPLNADEVVGSEAIRFRTLGCYPLTGAMRSSARTIDDIIAELKTSVLSERSGRLIDNDTAASMELKKREGYF